MSKEDAVMHGPGQAERRNKWSFFEVATSLWTWWVEHPDGSAAGSESRFPSLNECLADAARHGYVLPPESRERRANPSRPPATMISQEVSCPDCGELRELDRGDFVLRGDSVHCPSCKTAFIATSENVMCCVEDAEGLLQLPLP
jgi:hypothetical protein